MLFLPPPAHPGPHKLDVCKRTSDRRLLNVRFWGVKQTLRFRRVMSANDAVDGANSTVSKCYNGCVESESNQGGETTANLGADALKELARTRRRNADKVVPGIGRTRLGQR